MKSLLPKIASARSILLSTHRSCDGDGLGSELALYHSIKASQPSVDVQIVNCDRTPKKYKFLNPDDHIQYFDENPKLGRNRYDLCLIFDTNDSRLLNGLYKEIEKVCDEIAFIDHHPPLQMGPQATDISWLEPQAASTGEMTYDLIRALGLELNSSGAEALYTSIVFDTQLFRFVRNSPKSHEICAELLKFNVSVETVHRALFGNQTVDKIAFLSKALGDIRYHFDGRVATLKLSQSTLEKHNIDIDETRDIIDMIMNIDSVEAAAVFREDAKNVFKLSLRSKGQFEVTGIAELFGGGGHKLASGATLYGSFDELESEILSLIEKNL